VSSAETRQAIADAVNTVDAINVSPYFRQTTRPGEGMVRLDRMEWPNPLGALATWQVVVILPQDLATAEQYLDTKVSALVEAASKELAIRRVTPQQLTLDTGAVPCVFIEGQRESE